MRERCIFVTEEGNVCFVHKGTLKKWTFHAVNGRLFV